MIINMTTIASRRTHYIDQTLESLFRSDGRHIPVNLILGSSDTSHVEKYRTTLNIVSWDQESESQARADHMRHNCNLNAIRALKYGDDDYCLCCEDDIGFDESWFSQLMLTIAEIPDTEYVLNLGQGCDQSPDKRYAIHTPSYLCGAQGVFYPSKLVRKAVAEFVQTNIHAGMNDHLVGRYAKEHAVLYNTTPVLIGHLGQISSFDQPSPPEEPSPPVKPSEEAPRTQDAAEMSTDRIAIVEQPFDHTARPSVTRVKAVPQVDLSGRVTSEILVGLLRASLGTGAQPDATRLAECDWKRLALLATHHGLVPILYRALRDRAASVPTERLKRFKAQYVANVFHNQLAQMSVDEIGTAFGTERVAVIVMKGAALLRTLYEDPGLRVLGDIDLLVDERDAERAGAQLQRLGLELLSSEHDDQRGPLCHIHLTYCRPQPRSIPVELHWRLFEPYQPYVFDLDVVRAQARQLSGMPPNVLVMAPEHELAHLCVHLDRHAETYRSLVSRKDWFDLLLLPQGLGRLQWLYDIALYLQNRSALIDWDSFVSTARRWAIDGRLHATLELSRRALGVGPPPEVLRALNRGQPRFVERLAHRVVWASHSANEMQRGGAAGGRRARWLSRLSADVLRFTHTWMSVFPPSAYLHAKYATPGSSIWLRCRHFREVAPGLCAEIRDRWRSAVADR